VLSLQSRNFDEYRRKLAAEAPRVAPQARESTGKLEASVTDTRPAAKSPNKLMLSDGKVSSVSAEEQRIAARLARLASLRAARLSREASEVSRLQQSGTGAPPTAAAAASAASAAGPVGAASVPATPTR
jgi:pilus assembly protein FimV